MTKSDVPLHWFDLFEHSMLEYAFSFLDISADKKSMLLDMGCGDGHKTECFRLRGNRAIGMDCHARRLSHASDRYPSSLFVCGDILSFPFRDMSLDAIFSFSVLQYVDWRNVIVECSRMLKPGGRAVFIENLSGSPLAKGYRWMHRLLKRTYPIYQTPVAHLPWNQLNAFKDLFAQVESRAFHLTTPAILVKPALQSGLWGRSMKVSSQRTFNRLRKIDTYLLERIPALSACCWHAVIRVEKKSA